MIKPTVGRVVWYYPAGAYSGQQPSAAIITHVENDSRVNLAVFGITGNTFGRTSVLLAQDDGIRPEGEYCAWMPYQIGQAKRHEAEAVAVG